MKLKTPYYLIDEKKLLRNLRVIKRIREVSGAKSLLALKCFSTWAVFGLMRKYMDGATSSSLYEARLGREEFGKEVHAYCVGYSGEDIKEIRKYSDTLIFNSISQLERFKNEARGMNVGIRVNPGVSYSHFDLADPARKYSRLGITGKKALLKILPRIKGVMFHYNCENDNFDDFSSKLDYLEQEFSGAFSRLEWVSLGGGFYFTREGYPSGRFSSRLKAFSRKYGVQVYLEPGEAAITDSAELVTSVVDIVRNRIDIAVVDASVEAHMLDLLIYRTPAKLKSTGPHKYMVAGRSCLAGDVFGTYNFRSRLKIGSIIRISDAAGYSMVKKNWFNGLQMPSIVIRKLNGALEQARSFSYNDYKNSLS